MSFEEGALLEPLSVALAGIERSGLRLGDPLVICGAGPIGMVSLLAAHAAGAAPIVITDLDENRLQMAKSLVPRVRTVQIQRGEEPEAIGENIKKALGQEAKLVLECTGVQSSIHSGIYVSSTANRFDPSADPGPGLSIWRYRLRDRRGQGGTRNPVHVHIFSRDRHPLPVPLQGNISQSHRPGVRGTDRLEAAGDAPLHAGAGQGSVRSCIHTIGEGGEGPVVGRITRRR